MHKFYKSNGHYVEEKVVDQIKADIIDEICNTLKESCFIWTDDDGNCWNTNCPFCDDECKVEILKRK